jgi:hypothetical protein
VALPSTLSSWFLSASGLSSVLSVIIFILYSVPVCQRSLWAGIGPAPSTGRRPAVYSSIGPCAHVYLYVLVFNVTNMHAMCHRSDFFLACTFKGNIEEPAVYPTITYRLTVTNDKYHRFQFPPAMSDSNPLNTFQLQLWISSKTECVLVHDWYKRTLPIIFDSWWASMNPGSKLPVAWNDSKHGPSWWLYLHCGIEDTSSLGIICIICHQVPRYPAEHGSSAMGTGLLDKPHIAYLKESTESKVHQLTRLTVDETALAILMRHGSRGIQIIGLHR